MPSLSSLNPWLRPHAERFFEWARKQPGAGGLTITSARRTYEEQARLYQKFLAGQNDGLPAVPPGSSDHEVGLAWDMARLNVDPKADQVLAALGAAWVRAGGRWWSGDPVHFAAPLPWLEAARRGLRRPPGYRGHAQRRHRRVSHRRRRRFP